jgi:hypothetical protein
MGFNGKSLALASLILLVCLVGSVDPDKSLGSSHAAVHAAQPSDSTLQEQADALIKNAEEMVAHGGMGDAKAIIHHCAEASRHAETLLTQIPSSDPRRTQASVSLNEVINQCKRVSEIGSHADPGKLLNPAIKARAAARESISFLGLVNRN